MSPPLKTYKRVALTRGRLTELLDAFANAIIRCHEQRLWTEEYAQAVSAAEDARTAVMQAFQHERSEGPEKFKDINCPIRSVEIERGEREWSAGHVGELWLGAEWVTVAQARVFRDWLNEVIP